MRSPGKGLKYVTESELLAGGLKTTRKTPHTINQMVSKFVSSVRIDTLKKSKGNLIGIMTRYVSTSKNNAKKS